jgi:hypothetical protein
MAEVEYITIVLTVPILLRLFKKKKYEIPKPATPRRTIFGISARVMFIGIPKSSTIAKRQLPPIVDLSCISLAASILWLAILEMLLSNPQNTMAARIRKSPSLFIFKIEAENSRLLVIIMTPTITNAIDR